MKLVAVAVFDNAAKAFNRPFFVPSVGLAIRSFQNEVNRQDDQNPMFGHPGDFALFNVGEFDDENGLLVAVSPPERLVTALDVKEK